MNIKKLLAACALTMIAPSYALAQDSYPNKPIKIVVPFSAGGVVDQVARLLGDKMSTLYDQPVIVENRTGAGGSIGTDYAARAPADGYTLLLVSPSHAVAPSIQKNITWNPVRDFKAIAGFGIVPNVIVVHPSVPAKTIGELIELAKTRSEPLTYSTAGIGTSNHLSGELLAQEAHITLTHVPYKGQSDALNDLLGGRVDMMPLTAALAMQHVKAGKLRALAVTTAQRASVAPDLPTVAEATDLSDYEVGTWFGMVAPAKIPAPIREKLAHDVSEIMAMPDVKEKLTLLGMELTPQSPEEFDAYVESEFNKWHKVFENSNIGAN